ncbi:MAG: YqaA family protein [Candidatus Anstonellaceae archaeon]
MQKLRELFILFAIILLTIWTIYYSEAIVKYFGGFSYLGVFILSFVASASLFIPLGLMQTTIVFLSMKLDIFYAALLAGLGSAIGESTGYVFGKEAKEVFSKNKLIKKIQKIENKLLKKYQYLAVLLLSFLPNPIFDFVGIYCGVKKIPYIYYLILTFIGRTARYLFLIWFGNGLEKIF